MYKKPMTFFLTALIFITSCNILVGAENIGTTENGIIIPFSSYHINNLPNCISAVTKGNVFEMERAENDDTDSLLLKTINASDMHINISKGTALENYVVLDTKVLIRNKSNVVRRFFTLTDSENHSAVLLTVRSGTFRLFDQDFGLQNCAENVFYQVSLLLDFTNHNCKMYINGSLVKESKFSETLKNVAAIRMQVSSTVQQETNTYFKYINAYEGKQILDESALPLPEAAGVITAYPNAHREISETEIKERFTNQIVMLARSNQARFNNSLIAIDAENANIMPYIIGHYSYAEGYKIMLPFAFVINTLGGEAHTAAGSSAVSALLSGKQIVMAEEAKCSIDGIELPLSAAPEILDNYFMVAAEDMQAILDKCGFSQWVFADRSGIIVIGSEAAQLSMSDETDVKALNLIIRDVGFDSPDSNEVIERFKTTNTTKVHPRLFIKKDEVTSFRQRATEDIQLAKWKTDILTQANVYLNANTLVYGVTDGIRMLTTSREAQSRIWTLSMAYLLTNEDVYAEGAISEMLNVSDQNNFPDWHPYHFLDAAEMAAGVALGYDWCYNYMIEEERNIIRDALVRNALSEVMRDYSFDPSRSRSWFWNGPGGAYPQNWVAVCNGSMALAAMAIGDESEELELLMGQVISMGFTHTKDLMALFNSDGAYIEGVTYWEYAMKFLGLYSRGMQTVLGTDFGISKAPGLSQSAYYYICNSGPRGSFNLNSSAVTAGGTAPELLWLADEMGNLSLADYKLRRGEGKNSRGTVRDMLYYTTAMNNENFTLPLDYYFRNFEIAEMRTGFSSLDMYAALHGGERMGNHSSHLDSGSFVLDMNGVRWALDFGTVVENYYSSSDMYNRYKMRAEGHNTLVLNPDAGLDQNQYSRSVIEKFEYNAQRSMAITDLTEAYAFRGAENVLRGILMDKADKSVILQDKIKMRENSEIYWFMHTEANIQISEDGKEAALIKEGKTLYAQIISDSTEPMFTKMEAVPLASSPQSEGAAGVEKLVIHMSGVKEIEFAVRFSEKKASAEVKLLPMQNWTAERYTVKPIVFSMNNKPLDVLTPGTISASLWLNANDGQTHQAKYIIAAYQKDTNMLYSLDMRDITIDEKMTEKTLQLTVPDDKIEYVLKCFLWGDYESCIPFIRLKNAELR